MADFGSIDRIFRGSIDMHVHHGPDTFMLRRVDALEAARQAQQAGQRAIVLKSHKYPTAPLATIISQVVPGVQVFGSICLDAEMGGLNSHALKCSAQLGAKVVWMPTSSARNSINKIATVLGIPAEGPGCCILDEKGRLVPEIAGILDLVKAYDLVLANGHMSPAETFALFEAARARGINKLVVTHPLETDVVDLPVTIEDQKRLAQMGAFIEHTVFGLLPTSSGLRASEVAAAIRVVGPERVIISSDLGQIQNPPPAEGMRIFIAALLKEGFSAHDVELMAKVNPAGLLGLAA